MDIYLLLTLLIFVLPCYIIFLTIRVFARSLRSALIMTAFAYPLFIYFFNRIASPLRFVSADKVRYAAHASPHLLPFHAVY